uniref:Non-capsid protein n=1 Tax=Maize stripe virus TaxID=3052767 RepID=A0A8F5LPS7_MSTV|nr:non-capsid protein [Tenuivirus zeae]QXN57592.1 non-capsid protein [Tenuivirus zeae]QXN57594.1 non-capsid protein [Tenuivirus zeae]QXN57596.1 non-capsid protein [Tenuivirus zeae]QXN57598.1 non-capsid protein [Tenuivirus zeae]
MQRSADVSIGPITGLNYTDLYDSLPSSVSDNITLLDLKEPERVTEATKKLILKGCVETAYHHPLETDPLFASVHKHLPDFCHSFLEHLLGGEQDENSLIDIGEFFKLLQPSLGDWITKYYLKHPNKMSGIQIKTLLNQIINMAKAESSDTETYEKVWKKMPSYFSIVLTPLLHKTV